MIKITQEMLHYAERETQKRMPYIHAHFEAAHYSEPAMRHIISFIGEFACQQYLGLDWKKNIRANYLVPDDYDCIYQDLLIDIKTETIPNHTKLKNVIQHTIDDDEPYGRRLICENQFRRLHFYDLVIFGCILRPTKTDTTWTPVGAHWYPIGLISSQEVLDHYQPTRDTPFQRTYPEPCVNIHTSRLEKLCL